MGHKIIESIEYIFFLLDLVKLIQNMIKLNYET